MVPVDEAEDAELADEESSSGEASSVLNVSVSSSSSASWKGGSAGRLESFAFANCLCNSLMVARVG